MQGMIADHGFKKTGQVPDHSLGMESVTNELQAYPVDGSPGLKIDGQPGSLLPRERGRQAQDRHLDAIDKFARFDRL